MSLKDIKRDGGEEKVNKCIVVLCRWTRAAANNGVPSTWESGKVPSQAQAGHAPVGDICSADL